MLHPPSKVSWQADRVIPGLYESLLTSDLQAELGSLSGLEAILASVDPADQPHVLTRHLSAAIQQRLTDVKDVEQRLSLAAQILSATAPTSPTVTGPIQQLHAVRAPAGLGQVSRHRHRPKTPLNDAALLTNAHGEPSLAAELKAEIDSADSNRSAVCVRDVARTTTARGAARGRRTTPAFRSAWRPRRTSAAPSARPWIGWSATSVPRSGCSTTRRAPGCTPRRGCSGGTPASTPPTSGRPICRPARCSTVSSGTSGSSRSATPALMQKFEATFDSYWNSAEFEPYDPDQDRDRLDDALAAARGARTGDRVTISISGLEVRPFPYQQEMLDAIEVERIVHDRHRNLVVAATGTGKTVVAALDYRRLCLDGQQPAAAVRRPSPRDPRAVAAHLPRGARRRRLRRALRRRHPARALAARLRQRPVADVVRHREHPGRCLRRRGHRRVPPRRGTHLPPDPGASAPQRAPRSHGDARTSGRHRRTLASSRDARPRSCDCGTRWAPTCCARSTTSWWPTAPICDPSAGREDATTRASSSNVYTGNDARARIVLRQLRDKVADVASMRALGFCVSVAHAEYMARVFNEAGIPARAVSGETPRAASATGPGGSS